MKALIVDVSCGLGHLLKFLKERGFEGDYLGIGLQEEMVARAHRRYPEAGFEAADFLEDKLESTSFETPRRRSIAFPLGMTTTRTWASVSPTRWRCWNSAVASRHASCFATSIWHTTTRSKCTSLKDCYAEKSPGRTNDRGKGAQGGCFLGRKKDLVERFFPATTRRGAGIFCGAIFEEIRVLYTIEHLVHPWQWIAADMMDRI